MPDSAGIAGAAAKLPARMDIWGTVASPSPTNTSVLGELTPAERAFALKQRVIESMSAFMFPFQASLSLSADIHPSVLNNSYDRMYI
jgi:hypothetical protein